MLFCVVVCSISFVNYSLYIFTGKHLGYLAISYQLLGALPYFMLGPYLIGATDEKIDGRIKHAFCIAAIATFTLIVFGYANFETLLPDVPGRKEYFYRSSNYPVHLYSISVFFIMYQSMWLDRIARAVNKRVLKAFSNATLGVFMIHPIPLKLLIGKFPLPLEELVPAIVALWIVVLAFAVFFISLIVSMAARKVVILNHFF